MATLPNSSTDVMTLDFIDISSGDSSTILGTITSDLSQQGQSNVFGAYVEIALEKDFFVPSNGLTFVIAGNNLVSILGYVSIGYQVQVSINGNYQMIGYVFDLHLDYDRHGTGTKLTIKVKDLLEYMAQGSVPPNMATGSSLTFQFLPGVTFAQAFQVIANAFVTQTGSSNIIIETDNSGSLTVSSGGTIGVNVPLSKVSSTAAKNRSKSIQTAISHLEQPTRGGETYLAYMLRLAKHIGCEIKMSDNQPNVIFIKPPVYDRQSQIQLYIYHYLTHPKNQQNNVHDAKYTFRGDKQPSVVIMEMNTNGDGREYQGRIKGVAVNEITGYQSKVVNRLPIDVNIFGIPEPVALFPGRSYGPLLPTVLQAIAGSTAGPDGTGWFLSNPNVQLQNWLSNNSLPLTFAATIALPHYSVDPHSHTSGLNGEISYSASKYLSECQDKFFEIEYTVDGWSYNNNGERYVWQPDLMVNVYEEAFSPGSPISFTMWIKKVQFIKKRSGGTETKLTLSIPYTHLFEITNTATPSVSNPTPSTPPAGYSSAVDTSESYSGSPPTSGNQSNVPGEGPVP